MRSAPDVGREGELLYPGWSVVAAAISGVVLGYAVLVPYTFSLFLKPLSAAFLWRRDQVAVAFSCVAISAAVSAPMLGWMLDRFRARRVILPCAVLFGGIFASLSTLTSSLPRFYISFVLLGCVANGTTQLAYSRSITSWFFARRGMALALVSAGAGIGSIVLPLLTAWLISHFGWRAAYRDLGLLVILFSLPAVAFLRQRGSETHPAASATALRAWREAVRTKPYLLLIAAIFLYSISFNATISHFAPLLTDRGFTLATASRAIALVGVCGLLGRLVTGFLLDRFFGPQISVLFLLTTVVAMQCLCSAAPAAAFAGASLLGFAAGGESDITPYLISRYFGLGNFSSLYGMAWTAFALGTAVGPVLMGRLYTYAGSYRAWGLELLALPALVAALMMTRMPAYERDTALDPEPSPVLTSSG